MAALDPSVSPIANLIPERTYLAVSLSKCIAPALRISFLLTPDVAAEQMLRNNLQATAQMAPPLNGGARYALASFRRRRSDRYCDP